VRIAATLAAATLVIAACGGGDDGVEFTELVVYGDSITLPDDRNGGASFADLVADDLGLELTNRGAGSYTSRQTADRAVDEWKPGAQYVMVHVGINDVALEPDSPERRQAFVNGLRDLLATLSADPAPRILVNEILYLDPVGYERNNDTADDALVNVYNELLAEVVAEFAAAEVVEIDGLDTATMLDADGVHPNATGARLIADAVLAVIA